MQAPAQIKHRKAPLKTRLWNYKWFYVMFLPVFVALIVFHYLPMFGISLAFFRYQPSKIANPLEFTGLANFQKLFSRPQFWSSFTNTLEISIIKLLLNTFMAVIISLLLNEMVSTKMKNLPAALHVVGRYRRRLRDAVRAHVCRSCQSGAHPNGAD